MFERLARPLLRAALGRPWLMLWFAALLSVPAAWQANRIRLDTDLKRLLPKDSPAVRWSRELETTVGDGGYFSVIYEGDDPAVLGKAVEETARAIAALPDVRSVEYRNPVEFIRRYRYMLVPSRRLEDVLDRVDRLETEVNPLVENLEEEPAQGRADPAEVDRELDRWVDLPETHRSADGRFRGLIVRPVRAVTSLGAIRDLFARLQALVADDARRHGLWGGVSGSLRNKVDIYLQIREDLNRSGTVAGLGILVTLLVAFRALRLLPVVLLPIGAGLLWSYGLVPLVVGDLNIMTSFLLMVLFGMGIEFSVHLVKRFQYELARGMPVADALSETFLSTGRSILTSGLATTLGMAVLAASRLRGFAEFGIISGVSIFAIFLAMFLVLPSVLVLGARYGVVGAAGGGRHGGIRWVPSAPLTAVVLAAAVAGGVLAGTRLGFDYDFENLQAEIPAAATLKAKHREVYSGFSAPAAVYAVRGGVQALDRALGLIEGAKARHPDTIGSLVSMRDFAPGPEEWEKRRALLAELQERLAAPWTRRVKDPKKQRWIRDLREFTPPGEPPRPEDLPPEVLQRVSARDGSGAWTLGVDTAGRPRDGRMAMAFTGALYELRMPGGVQGPTGDKPVFAEILWLVTEEGPWLVAAALLGVLVLVLADRRKLGEALWVMLPLVCGLLLTLGAMALLGWKVNFFNVIVFPNLIGNAVDNGVHWFRRWKETGHATSLVQEELAGPLTVSAATTVMGYGGMVFAHHAGLRSIGGVAVLGLCCCWLTGVVLMPGVLALLARRRSRGDKALAREGAEGGAATSGAPGGP